MQQQIFTPLFSQQLMNGGVVLIARNEAATYKIEISDIDYYFDIGLIPGMNADDFEKQLKKQIFQIGGTDSHYNTERRMMIDSEMMTFDQPWTFFRIHGNLYDIRKLLREKESCEIVYTKNNYLLRNFTEEEITDTLKCSELFYWYRQEFLKHDNLIGMDLFIQQIMAFPFRWAKQDIVSVQIKHNINFQDTIVIDKCVAQKVQGFKYDYIIKTSLKGIKQALVSQLDKDLQYYKYCMFDVENAVVQKQYMTFNKCKKAARSVQVKNAAIQKIAEKVGMTSNKKERISYNGSITSYEIQDKDVGIQQIEGALDTQKYGDTLCDQHEIICVSFVVANFKNEILEKIALTRSPYTPTKGHADRVIVAESECDLLEKLITILGDRDYNMIMHFNGWGFDEKMIMSRMLLYGLIEKYFRAISIDGSFDKYAISVDSSMKISSTFFAQDMFQIVNPLRFSFDVFALNKKTNADAEKLESLGLGALLRHYGLADKEDVSYQEITDAWFHKDYEFLNKVYDYCQFDSIQTVQLQKLLGLLMQNIQMSNITRVPLDQCVFKAVSAKVAAVVDYAYRNYAFCDIYNPFTRPFQPNPQQLIKHQLNLNEEEESESSEEQFHFGKKKEKYLVVVGGEVICVQPGFYKIVTAVDAESMYPAQKEANNVDKTCILLGEQIKYILKYPQLFGVEYVKIVKVVDMYTPYISEDLVIDIVDDKFKTFFEKPDDYTVEIEYGELNKLARENDKELKAHRWFVYLTVNGKEYEFQQFFYQKKNQVVSYPFVFIRQGKENSPKGVILTTFRKLRQETKKKLGDIKKKEIKTQDDRDALNFLDSKQQSIKVLMNSEYGLNEYEMSTAYNMFESALVTKSSRYMIQNCRDVIQSRQIVASTDSTTLASMKKYNDFLLQTVGADINFLIIQKGEFFTNPNIMVIYQDTDSNYIKMIELDSIQVLPQFKEDANYVKTTLFGLYNAYFCDYLRASMNKYPLNFAFEGAFFHAWYIAKKNYLGQKIKPITCEIQDNKLVKFCELNEKPCLSDYDDSKLIGEYLEEKHIKVMGLKIVKRNVLNITKKLYLKLIERVLQGIVSEEDQFRYIHELIVDLKQNFDNLKITDFTERKKITPEFLDMHPKIKQKYNPGIGTIVDMYYSCPKYLVDPFQVLTIKKADYMELYTGQQNTNIYKGHYILQVAMNLLKVINNDLTQKEVEERCEQMGYVSFGKQKRIKVDEIDQEEIYRLFDILIQYRDQNAFMEYNGASVSLLWIVNRLSPFVPREAQMLQQYNDIVWEIEKGK